MNKSVMELLETVSVVDFLLAFLLIFALTVLVMTQKEKLMKHLNKWRKDKNEEEDFHSLVYEMKKSIEDLSKKVEQNQLNRDKELLHYRDDSRKIRDEMYRVMNSQSEQIKSN